MNDLPEDSLFDDSDYREMRRVADRHIDLLTALDESDGLDSSTLGNRVSQPVDEVDSVLKELCRVALVVTREDPSREPSRYHEITDLGRVIVRYGVVDGVKRVRAEEFDF